MVFQHEPERIFALGPNGQLIAEVTFPVSCGTAVIDHTYVDSSFRGRGIAGKLLSAAVEQIRSNGLKAHPACSFAVKWFAEHPEYSDLLSAP